MRYTSAIKLMLPDIGSTQNWGTAVNYNFTILDGQIQKLNAELANTRTLIGAGIPYYKELYTTNVQGGSIGPYKFVYIENVGDVTKPNWVFTYYTGLKEKTITVEQEEKTTIVGDDLSDFVTYYQTPSGTQQSLNAISEGTGAYVINNEPITFDIGNGAQTFSQGDLIVALSEVGSIFDATYVSIKFEKYPDTGHYIEPELKVENHEVKIDYNKHNYVQWYIRDANKQAQIYPTIYATNHTFTQGDSEIEITFLGLSVAPANCSPRFSFFTQDYNTKIDTPIFLAYNYKIVAVTNGIKIILTVDPQKFTFYAKIELAFINATGT